MTAQTFTATFIQYDYDVAYFRGLKDQNNNLLCYLFGIEIRTIADLIGKLFYECIVTFEASYVNNQLTNIKNMRVIYYHGK